MTLDDLLHRPHRRFNPLTREWVVVSPQRMERPWQGLVEKPPQPAAVAYKSTFVFDNDFAALLPTTAPEEVDVNGLLIARGERGSCRVVCLSARHDLTLALM